MGSGNKLEETLDLPVSDDDLLKELEERYKYSDDPDLKEVAMLALEAYKSQMIDSMNFEPKYRSRALEVARQYLDIAKDALSKKEDYEIKREKNAPKGKDDENDNEEPKIGDRNGLLLELHKNKKEAS